MSFSGTHLHVTLKNADLSTTLFFTKNIKRNAGIYNTAKTINGKQKIGTVNHIVLRNVRKGMCMRHPHPVTVFDW